MWSAWHCIQSHAASSCQRIPARPATSRCSCSARARGPLALAKNAVATVDGSGVSYRIAAGATTPGTRAAPRAWEPAARLRAGWAVAAAVLRLPAAPRTAAPAPATPNPDTAAPTPGTAAAPGTVGGELAYAAVPPYRVLSPAAPMPPEQWWRCPEPRLRLPQWRARSSRTPRCSRRPQCSPAAGSSPGRSGRCPEQPPYPDWPPRSWRGRRRSSTGSRSSSTSQRRYLEPLRRLARTPPRCRGARRNRRGSPRFPAARSLPARRHRSPASQRLQGPRPRRMCQAPRPVTQWPSAAAWR